MPRYKVLKPGFYSDRLYDPNGKRNELTTDKPLDPCPSWLESIKEESATARKKREAADAKAAKEAADKAKEDKKDVDAAMFTQPPAAAQVETL